MEWIVYFFIYLLARLSPYPQASTGVVYYVKPTEPCAHNSSFPSGEECQTMDHYASNSSHYFSSDHINVTLYFLCGVHNCTERMDIRDLQTFVMKGTAGRHGVVINMIPKVVPAKDPKDGSNQECMYTFANVSDVIIEQLTTNSISVNFEGYGCRLSAKHLDFYGPVDSTSLLISVINITGYHALFDACTFQRNTFVRLQFSTEFTIKDSKFHSYNHINHTAIGGTGYTVVLSGAVNFTNNTVGSLISTYATCGGVIFLSPIANSKSQYSSVLNISQGSNIYFIGNTADCGGAFYLNNSIMNVGSKVNMTLHENKERKYRNIPNYFFGGAILAKNSTIIVGENTNILISRNIASYGGAIYLWKNSVLVVNRNAIINFINNTAHTLGGAISLELSYFSITNATLLFRNNTAIGEAGGAISLIGSSMDIREHANVTFINNMATLQGGAVYQSIAGHISIDLHSRLEFCNNSAGQGGALYLTSSGNIIVGDNSLILFTNNSAFDVGGAVYVDTYLPCFLFLKSNSIVLKFVRNTATNGGSHMYGASIRRSECADTTPLFRSFPYCGTDSSNINLVPDLDNSSSPVSSDPKRVCLCDLSGQPQCANLSYIFVDAFSVYPGERIKLSMVVVGHDFGVITGIVHANFWPLKRSNLSALDDDQYHQWIEISRQCSNLIYTIYSANELYLQTSTNTVSSSSEKSSISDSISEYKHNQDGCLKPNLLTTPVFINITLLSGCPPGFSLNDWRQGCSCYPILQTNQFNCSLANNTGYIKWNSTMWIAADTNQNSSTELNNIGILVSQYCPLEHCRSGEKVVDLSVNSDAQCAFNHAGILCGACRKNYSLAIGSSHCIKCSSDSHVALFIFFIAAGVLLVILLFLFNLTVTEGLVNGLIFYANILWIYKSILFHSCRANVSCIELLSGLYSLARFRLWNRDMLYYWSECLLEDVPTVSVSTLHLVDCWNYHYGLPLFLSSH